MDGESILLHSRQVLWYILLANVHGALQSNGEDCEMY